jgi:hypothetical protein
MRAAGRELAQVVAQELHLGLFVGLIALALEAFRNRGRGRA